MRNFFFLKKLLTRAIKITRETTLKKKKKKHKVT